MPVGAALTGAGGGGGGGGAGGGTNGALTVTLTRAVPVAGDLVDLAGPNDFVWLHDGAGFVATGVAATVPADEVEGFVDEIQSLPSFWRETGERVVL